jgi:hypothetical protein
MIVSVKIIFVRHHYKRKEREGDAKFRKGEMY